VGSRGSSICEGGREGPSVACRKYDWYHYVAATPESRPDSKKYNCKSCFVIKIFDVENMFFFDPSTEECSLLFFESNFLPIISLFALFEGLYYLVHLLLLMIVACEYLVLLPYEEQVRPSLLIPVYYVVGIYLIVCILYHYRKACSVDPGRPKFSDAEPRCAVCGFYKPEGTHHCSICGRCVLQMDHHCVWINQCVGLNNHRFFLQFVLYVWFAQCLILLINYTSFWEHFYSANVRLFFSLKKKNSLKLLFWLGLNDV
ncbi:unnamed protein product, partial [Gongylonema pulchrum]|uniref:Palmitoyltransferase n=1 Tax=Gongylonema pulchrum TaxID=637853 RepID=A0A183CW38_9BILA